MPDQIIREEDVLDFINSKLKTPKSTIPQKYIVEFFPYNQFNLKRSDSDLIKKIISDLATKEKINITYRSVVEGGRIIRVPIIEPFSKEKAKKGIQYEPIEKRINLKKLIRRKRLRGFENFLIIFVFVSSLILLIWSLIFVKIPLPNWEQIQGVLLLISILIYIGFCCYCWLKK